MENWTDYRAVLSVENRAVYEYIPIVDIFRFYNTRGTRLWSRIGVGYCEQNGIAEAIDRQGLEADPSKWTEEQKVMLRLSI
jgi:hypothetical protein